MIRKYLYILLTIFLSACAQLSYEDVSSYPEYKPILGKKFEISEDMWAISVTADKNYKKITDYVVIVPGVGFSGPEVVRRDVLEKGTIFEVSKVWISKSIISKKIVLIVKLDNEKYADSQVRVKIGSSIEGDNFGLNQRIFSMVSD